MSYLLHSGPFVWLVLLFGLVGLAAAAVFARSYGARPASLALGSVTASVIFALLGTVTGFQKSVAHLGEVAPDKRWIYLIGLQESLGNVVVALAFALLVTLLLTAGAFRRA